MRNRRACAPDASGERIVQPASMSSSAERTRRPRLVAVALKRQYLLEERGHRLDIAVVVDRETRGLWIRVDETLVVEPVELLRAPSSGTAGQGEA